MPHLETRCPQCNRIARYTADEGGLPALCHACGAEFTYPAAEEPIYQPAPAPIPLPARAANGKRAVAGHSAAPWIIAGLAVVVVAAGVALAWALTAHSALVAQRAVARQILQEADDLYMQHRYADARTRFRDLANQYPQSPSDSELRHLVSRARQRAQDMDQLVALASQAPNTAGSLKPTPSPAPAPPIATKIQPVPTPPAEAPSAPSPPPQSTEAAVPVQPPPPVDHGPQLPPVQPIPVSGGLTDQQIFDSIHKGADYLMTAIDQQDFEVRDTSNRQNAEHAGIDALCVYALIMAGQTVNDPRLAEKGPFITGCLDRLKQFSIEGHDAVYARALRVTALSALNRPEDREAIQADAEWLVAASHNGAYTYDAYPARANASARVPNQPNPPAWPAGIAGQPGFPPRRASAGQSMPNFWDNIWDNSNSQYGLMGVWSAAEVGVNISPDYWKAVENHWTTTQLSDGRWTYDRGNTPRLSMTCAGLASLFVAQDYLQASQAADDSGQNTQSPALTHGMAWLEAGDNSVNVRGAQIVGYTDYGIERVGLACGYKYFGAHDWYREVAGQLIHDQRKDGSWGGSRDGIDSAYCLLFLSRGSHPILMNKLRFDGNWDDHPRDLVHLTNYVGEQLERPLNWQIVPADHGWQDWADSPVLYIASDKAPQLSNEQEQAIKSYIQNGGLLFTNSDNGSEAFDNWVAGLAKRLFPDYPMKPLTPKDELYNVVMMLSKTAQAEHSYRLRGVSNGARWLIIAGGSDMAGVWQANNKQNALPFELGMNLAVYASGKTQLRNRLSSSYIAPVAAQPLHTLNVARLRYDGNWDPEPAAWDRFGRVFQLATSWGITTADVDVADLKPGGADLAVLTGTDGVTFTAAQTTALSNYVKGGGVLLVDACGGSESFNQSITDQAFAQAFPGEKTKQIPGDHPLVSAGLPGMQDLSKPLIRQFAEQAPGFKPKLPRILHFGTGHVIYSPLDLTSGLLGTDTWGISGYSADYSIAFVQNALLWTARGQKDQ